MNIRLKSSSSKKSYCSTILNTLHRDIITGRYMGGDRNSVNKGGNTTETDSNVNTTNERRFVKPQNHNVVNIKRPTQLEMFAARK
jgi:hypothetical protein